MLSYLQNKPSDVFYFRKISLFTKLNYQIVANMLPNGVINNKSIYPVSFFLKKICINLRKDSENPNIVKFKYKYSIDFSVK